jgi:hypothetical protein
LRKVLLLWNCIYLYLYLCRNPVVSLLTGKLNLLIFFFGKGMLPHDPNVLVGDTLKVRCCRVRQSLSYNLSDVAFEFHLKDGDRHNPVHPRFTRHEDDSCVLLEFPDITEEYDYAVISCFVRQRRDLTSKQLIRVGCE